MTITNIPKMAELGLSTSTEKIITGTINVLTSTELKMDTYVGKRGRKCISNIDPNKATPAIAWPTHSIGIATYHTCLPPDCSLPNFSCRINSVAWRELCLCTL